MWASELPSLRSTLVGTVFITGAVGSVLSAELLFSPQPMIANVATNTAADSTGLELIILPELGELARARHGGPSRPAVGFSSTVKIASRSSGSSATA